jgi:hypothetical protein
MFRSSCKVNPSEKQKQQKKDKQEKVLRFQESERLKAAERRVQQERKAHLSALFTPGKLYSLTETKWAFALKRRRTKELPKDNIVLFLGVQFTERTCFLQVLFGEDIVEIGISSKESLETIARVLKTVDMNLGS